MATKVNPGEEYLGIGLYGPLRIGSSGDLDVKAGIDLIAESVKAIISTGSRFKNEQYFISGQRFMRDDFGSTQRVLKHENLDENTVALAESIYIEAIEKWEPRAIVGDISTEIDLNAQKLKTRITIKAKGTNDKKNIVVIRDSKGRIDFESIEGV